MKLCNLLTSFSFLFDQEVSNSQPYQHRPSYSTNNSATNDRTRE
jgi:hypothetical protein